MALCDDSARAGLRIDKQFGKTDCRWCGVHSGVGLEMGRAAFEAAVVLSQGRRPVLAAALCAFAFLGGCSEMPDPEPSQLMPAMSPIASSAAPVASVPIPVPQPVERPGTPRGDNGRQASLIEPGWVPQSHPTAISILRENAVHKNGRPYQVGGDWFYPTAGTGYDEIGVASWYGPDFQGHATANGEIYDMHRLTAAHPTLPLPCYVSVTNQINGRTIVVRVNDRGPYKHGRIIDLSERAARALGFTSSGTADVRVRYLRRAPLRDDGVFEERYLTQQSWYRGPTLIAASGPGWGQAFSGSKSPHAPLRSPLAGATSWGAEVNSTE
jgi:rare lipoprotein A (peptidoglycan hydrolase)